MQSNRESTGDGPALTTQQDIERVGPAPQLADDPMLVKASAIAEALTSAWNAAVEKAEASRPKPPEIPADVPQFVTEGYRWEH